jgi:mRNA interferase MazF
MIKRGEIYWVNLDPTIGSEIRKTRPAIIVSNDINNLHAQTVTVLPLSSSVEKVYPFEVLIRPKIFGNSQACKAKANQIRTVDKRRLGELIGILPNPLILQIDAALRLHLAL